MDQSQGVGSPQSARETLPVSGTYLRIPTSNICCINIQSKYGLELSFVRSIPVMSGSTNRKKSALVQTILIIRNVRFVQVDVICAMCDQKNNLHAFVGVPTG